MDFKKNDFSQAKVGDKVWSIEDGFGLIETSCSETIFVKFKNGHNHVFGCDGRYEHDALMPILFWNEIHFDIPERPKRMVKKEIKFWSCFHPRLVSLVDVTSDPATANGWALSGLIVRRYTDEIEIEE